MKASALRLLDPFYDQFSVLYRGLVIQFLLNSSFIIKYDVIFDNICYTISSYVSSLMEREGFRLENRVKPFDTAIICYFASFLRILTLLFPAIKVERLTPKHSKIIDTGHVFLYSSTSLIRLTLSILLSSSDTFLLFLPAIVTVPLQITVSSHYHKYIVSSRVGGNGTIHHSDTIATRSWPD